MRRRAVFISIFLGVILVAAGYLGYYKKLNGGWVAVLSAIAPGSQHVQAGDEPATPATIPVTRGDVQQTVIAPGELVGTQEIALGTATGGRLVEINVRPGDGVRKGDVLARLDPEPFQVELQRVQLQWETAEVEHERKQAEAELAVRMARLKLESAEAELTRQVAEAKLELQAAESQLTQARFQYPALTAVEIRLENALEVEAAAEVEYQESLERRQANWEHPDVAESYRRALEAARDQRMIAEAEFDAARDSQAAWGEALEILEANVERAKIALGRLKTGVDPLLALDLERAQQTLNDLARAGASPLLALEVQRAEADLKAATLIAPFSGTVLEVRARPGETVTQGSVFIALINPAAVEARVTVIEEDLSLVQVGQAAELFMDALPEAAAPGQVTRIVPQRVPGEGRPLYHVYISLEASSVGLYPGMTVDASIIIAARSDALRLPRALVAAGSGEMLQVEVWVDAHVQQRTIQVGMRGDLFVEILGGLRENELVLAQ